MVTLNGWKYFSLLLFFAAIFLTELSECKPSVSVNLKFKISDQFVQNIKNEIYDMVNSEMVHAKSYWKKYRDFDDKLMKETDDGVITVRSFASPEVSYQSFRGQNGYYDYINVRYPEVKIFWKYEFYYTPLWIPIYWGMGYNYYRVEDLQFSFRFNPPQYRNGQLSGVDLTLQPSTYYSGFVWTWDSGEGDQYGDYLNNRWYYDDVISSLSGYVRTEIGRSYRYRSFENNINRIIGDLPSMHNSGLIESSDTRTMMDMQKLINSNDMDYSTKFMYKYAHFWMDISMTPKGTRLPFSFDPNPPLYEVEIHLKNAAKSPEESVVELQRKALGMLTVNDLKTYFFPEGEHETFLKMNNSEQDDVLLTLSDKKRIMLSEVKEYERNTFYRNLNWQFQLAGIDIKEDFFAGPTVQHDADFSVYSLKGAREVKENATSYSVVTKVPCELRASLEDIKPPVENKHTMNEVTRKIAKFKEGVEQSCGGQQLETYWQVPKPRGMSFYGYGNTIWTMSSYNTFNLDFYAKLRND